MMKLNHFLIAIFLLVTAGSIAQVTFEARASKEKLGVNERLRIDFEMNQDGDSFRPPSFQGFRVIAGPNQSISNSWINGVRSYSKTFTYFLQPTGTGKFTIDQAVVEINGNTYKTVPIQIEVTPAVNQPTDGDNQIIASSGDIHLVAEISKSNPYLNEAITVVYKLYVSPETSVSGWREIDNPKYADFWSQNTDNQQLQIKDGTFQGKPYRYAILRSTVLYPQKTGKLTLDPLSLDVQVEVRTNKRDFWGRPIMTRTNQTITSGSKTVDVKALPEEGKPVNFAGAVGNFDFKVTTNKERLDARESLEVLVEATGNGNLKLFKLPILNTPNTFEVYEPEFNDRTTTTEKGMRGSISDSYTLVPQFQGSYTIAPIAFSYFDPVSETYKTINSTALNIEVEKGPIAITTQGDAIGMKQPVTMMQEQFKYIKLNPGLVSVEKSDFFKSPLFWALLGSPLLAIPLFILVGKKQKETERDVEGQRLKTAGKLAKKYLSEAQKNIDNDRLFYESLERALHNYLKAKLSLETSDFSKDRIKNILIEKQVEGATAEEFIGILKTCEFARYTPAAQGAMQQDYNKSVQVISTIDKQIV